MPEEATTDDDVPHDGVALRRSDRDIRVCEHVSRRSARHVRSRTASDRAVGRAASAESVAPHRAARPREPVTITWYHIQNNDPGLSLWKKLADEYTAEQPQRHDRHPGQRERGVQDQADDAAPAGRRPRPVPDLGRRRSPPAGRGRPGQGHHGRHRRRGRTTINAGALSMYEVDGKNYGVPFDLGLVGFWYNTEAFEEAGITAPPATWDEFLTTVQTLKDKGITPIALAGKDTWTGAFYWAYLAVRNCGQAGHGQGRHHRRLVRSVLRQGRRGLPAADRRSSRSRKASWPRRGTAPAARRPPQATYNGAMQLMGQWLPGTVQANSGDARAMGEGLGWFPFPARRRRARRRRSTASAAATASPSARTRRPRRSTSSSTSSASTRPTAGAP